MYIVVIRLIVWDDFLWDCGYFRDYVIKCIGKIIDVFLKFLDMGVVRFVLLGRDDV